MAASKQREGESHEDPDQSQHRHRGTFAAVVIVGLTGLTLDRGHDGALPKGVDRSRRPRDGAGRRT